MLGGGPSGGGRAVLTRYALSMSETPDATAIEEAVAGARGGDPASSSRRWLLETHAGTLCTLAARTELEGYPFGSVVPFALDERGRPVIFIAHIAAHTANLRRDPRGSLFVRQPDALDDPQTGWRITVMGRWSRVMSEDDDADAKGAPTERVSRDELERLHARYAERVPAVDRYDQTHGFAYWRMTHVDKVRFIGGFGKICWLGGDEVLRGPDAVEGAAGAVAHMNEDHVENMKEMCRGLYGVDPGDARMTHLEPTGFFVETSAPQRMLWFSFGREVAGDGVRHAIIEVLKRARARTAA